MDPISGFFEGALQPVVRLALFAVCMLTGCWVGLYLGHVDAFMHLTLREALVNGWTAMMTQYPTFVSIGAALPDLLIKGLLSVWKFPLVLCVPWLLFRIVIVDTGVLPLGGLAVASQSLQAYTVVGGGTAFSITLLLVLAVVAIAWHLWCWWRETNWVEALDGPQYVPKVDTKKEEEAQKDMYFPPVSTNATTTDAEANPIYEMPSGESEATTPTSTFDQTPGIASLYADEPVTGDSTQEEEDTIPGESEEERYHRLRQAREAREREERESRARLQQQKKAGTGGKGKGRV